MDTPKIVIFNCTSLDGRMDGGVGQTDMGLYYQLASCWKVDAMLSGSNTMLAAFSGAAFSGAAFGEDDFGKDDFGKDDFGEATSPEQSRPSSATSAGENEDETQELHPLATPYLVVVDSRGRIHNWAQIQAQPFWRQVIVLCACATPLPYREELARHNVACIIAGEERVDLRQALEILYAEYGVRTLRVDSGGALNGALLRAGLVDEVSVLIAPVLVGGESPQSMFVAPDVTSPEQAIPLKLAYCEQVGDGRIWLRYQVAL
jgi:2,5-diamino-6-(ribosylamino)-4(3H)-pyrimidinone 5'-phosphate reductase